MYTNLTLRETNMSKEISTENILVDIHGGFSNIAMATNSTIVNEDVNMAMK